MNYIDVGVTALVMLFIQAGGALIIDNKPDLLENTIGTFRGLYI